MTLFYLSEIRWRAVMIKKPAASLSYRRCFLLLKVNQSGHFQIFSILRFFRLSFLFYPEK